MYNKPNVWFVNTHTKSYSCHYHLHILVQKLVLPVSTQLGIKPRMVGNSFNIIGNKYFSKFFGSLPVKGIYNAAFIHVLRYKANHAFYRLVFLNLGLYFVIQVGAVE